MTSIRKLSSRLYIFVAVPRNNKLTKDRIFKFGITITIVEMTETTNGQEDQL